MTITHTLAGIAVFNIEESLPWYQRLLGGPPDRRPQETIAEWEFASGCGIQIFEDSERGGTSSVTLIDTDIDARIEDLKKQDIEIRSTSNTETSRMATIADPDGNQIMFAQYLNKNVSNKDVSNKDVSNKVISNEDAAHEQRRAVA